MKMVDLPPVEAKLLGKSSCCIDHTPKLVLRHLPVKVAIRTDKGPEQDVVELDVAVVGLVLAGPLHEVDELFLAVDIHPDSEEVLVTRC